MGDRGGASGKSGAGGAKNYQEVHDDSIFDDSVDNWKDDITSDERYETERYTGYSYYDWNDSLRNDNGKGWESDTMELDNALNKFDLKQNIVTYRGLGSSAVNSMFGGKLSTDELNSNWVGAVISDKAFLSTSISSSVAYDFSSSGYVLKINVPKGKGRGAYVDSISKHQGEREFLMPRNTKLKITGAYYDSNNGYTVITANYTK